MIVRRAMCTKEAELMLSAGRLSWNSRFKWFGVGDFVDSRVTDGEFNNSRYVPDRYSRVFEFEIDDSTIHHFSKCGSRELMLDRRKYPLVKIKILREVTGV